MLLVTGITGHTARYFIEELINNKYENTIRCIVRKSSDTSVLDQSGLKIEKVYGDLNDQEFMDRCMEGIDIILHIAGIRMTLTIIKAAVKKNVKRAILVHTTGIYSKYKSASFLYKNIEDEMRATIQRNSSPMNVTILRPTLIYGNLCDKNMVVFIKMVDKLRIFPVISHGSNLLQPVNARDLGKAYYQVLVKPEVIGGDYTLSGEKPISMIDMFKLISDRFGKHTTFVSVPLCVGVIGARCLKICSLGKIDYVEKVQRMGENRNFSHEDATRDFGYKPMSFAEGITIEVNQYIEKKKGI